MPHNFKEGIDWIADPTGATPLANHVFMSKSGDDIIGDGSPDNPYASLDRCITHVNSLFYWSIIIGTGVYLQTQNLTLYRGTVIGDGLVVFDGGSINSFLANTYSDASRYKNLVFSNFVYSFDLTLGNNNRQVHLEDIRLINAPIRSAGGSKFGKVLSALNCLLVNSDVSENHLQTNEDSTWIGCIFINSSVDFRCQTVKNCFFDEASRIDYAGKLNADGVNYDSFISYSNILSSLKIAGEIIDPSTLPSSFSLDPKYNNIEGFDFSLTETSPHIGNAERQSNIGAGFIANSFSQGVPLLDNALLANPNTNYNPLGEIENTGLNETETITLNEVEFEFIRYIGKVRISGFIDLVLNTPTSDNSKINPNFLTFEMRYAQNDGIWSQWKLYRFNEIPSLNADGKSNADVGYNWADNRKIIAKKYQVRLTILKTSYNAA